jgi:hypothetical protein
LHCVEGAYVLDIRSSFVRTLFVRFPFPLLPI